MAEFIRKEVVGIAHASLTRCPFYFMVSEILFILITEKKLKLK